MIMVSITQGAGDIELWKDYSEILEDYDYFFHYELRMLLKDSSFIKSFIDNPRNCFCLGSLGKIMKTDILVSM